MSFSYSDSLNKARNIEQLAETIRSYKSNLTRIESSINNNWKSKVSKVDELIDTCRILIDKVYNDMKQTAGLVEKAANEIRQEEIAREQAEQKRIAEEKQKAEEAKKAEEEKKKTEENKNNNHKGSQAAGNAAAEALSGLLSLFRRK